MIPKRRDNLLSVGEHCNSGEGIPVRGLGAVTRAYASISSDKNVRNILAVNLRFPGVG